MSSLIKNLVFLLVVIGVSLFTAWALYTYAPLSWFEVGEQEPRLGATITTINATDKISDSRAVINTNFANLNSDKIEVGTTTLPNITSLPNLVTVGTLTTGGLGSGFTVVNVAQGGTGSSTLSSNQVLLGNGTGAIKTVSGYGTSGQVLKSNGSGSAPSWAATTVDETANYTWTGLHTFTATTTFSNATTTFNGVNYAFPSSQAATSTVLQNDGTGILSWTDTFSKLQLLDIAPGTISASTASTTLWSTTISNNTLGTDNAVKCDMFSENQIVNNTKLHVEVGYGNASTSASFNNSTGGTVTEAGIVTVMLSAAGSATSQELAIMATQSAGGGTLATNNVISVDSKQDQDLVFIANTTDASSTVDPYHVVCQLIK